MQFVFDAVSLRGDMDSPMPQLGFSIEPQKRFCLGARHEDFLQYCSSPWYSLP